MNNEHLAQHEQLQDIFFPVEMKNSEDHFLLSNFASNLQKCIYLPQQNKVVQICGQSYHLVPNEDLMMPVYQKMISIFGEQGFTTNVSSYDDRRFYVDFTVDEDLHTILTGDKICPKVIVQNSYDGFVKQTVSIGYMRQICTNGLMAFTANMMVSVRHSKRYGLLNFEPIFKKLEQFEVKLEQFRKLTDRRVTPDELTMIVKKIRSNPSIKYPKKMIEPARLIAQKEAAELNTPLNAWLVYNGFNNPLNHFETRLLPEEAARIDKKVLRSIEKTLSLS